MSSPYNSSSNHANGLNGSGNAVLGADGIQRLQRNGHFGAIPWPSRRYPLVDRAFLTRPTGLQFKPSPFYEIDCQLGEVRHCEGRSLLSKTRISKALTLASLEAMANHRNSIPISLRASTFPELHRCIGDPSLRVMIFCSASNMGIQDVAFPYQCEIKVNGGEVKANLRGLKNKPGSTRPVDVTNLLRLKPPNYSNTLEFTYALTSKVSKQKNTPTL